MPTLAQLTKRRVPFEEFLTARGAQIMQPTNEWEVLRFKSTKGVSIVYRNSKDGLTFTGESADAWNAFAGNHAWRGAPATKRPKSVEGHVRALLARDGEHCFYCFKATTEENRTVEHLVARAHGGPNHLSNMVLAHRKCNSNAGHMSAMEKIRLRENNGSSL
jgi:hypothetical protein